MTALRDFDEQEAADSALSRVQQSAWESVVQGGWKLFAMVNQGLDDAGFASTDLRVMQVLGRAPRMRISDIAAATHMQMSTVSRQIGRFVDQGLVERVDDVAGDDARHRWVRPTACGYDYLRRLVEKRDEIVHQRVVTVLGEADFLALGRMFQQVSDSAGPCPDSVE